VRDTQCRTSPRYPTPPGVPPIDVCRQHPAHPAQARSHQASRPDTGGQSNRWHCHARAPHARPLTVDALLFCWALSRNGRRSVTRRTSGTVGSASRMRHTRYGACLNPIRSAPRQACVTQRASPVQSVACGCAACVRGTSHRRCLRVRSCARTGSQFPSILVRNSSRANVLCAAYMHRCTATGGGTWHGVACREWIPNKDSVWAVLDRHYVVNNYKAPSPL
jgi:hypothetical protein